ncbi:hypothetical protein EQZ23_09500 [Sphingomonas sp. UV9]|uniref:hypothetical protein n=1 Tax=Sphingomonas sp. UV9 TaxID=1851410 RepID=UPI000FFC6212|nr:hypothetical protein [Sphingomonas sp. UV9]RXD05317.1 hypothetical protein EQZ23_09500 [Sphingomonas sp. UV9]
MAIQTESAKNTLARNNLAQTAKNLVRVRCLGTEVFPSEIFDGHAWNMMLRLLVAHANEDCLSEGELIAATGTPPGVGQRWLAHLVADEQIEPYAAGSSIALTPAALDRVEVFLRGASAIHQTDGPS